MTPCKCKLEQFARLQRLADQVSAERDVTPIDSCLWHYLNDTAIALQEIAAQTVKESGGRPGCTALGLNILPSADAEDLALTPSRPALGRSSRSRRQAS